MEQAKKNQDELQRRKLQEYIFGLEEMREKAEDLALEHERLKKTQELLEAILSATTHGICLVKDKKLVWCNKGLSDIFGWDYDEMVGNSIDILYSETEDSHSVENYFSVFPSEEMMISLEQDFVRKNGTTVPCLVTGRILDKNDISKGCIFSFTDFSKQKEAENALKKAHNELEKRVEERTYELAQINAQLKNELIERKLAEEERNRLKSQLVQAQKLEAIGTLAGGIAHDFNNLLLGIMGNASLMLSEIDAFHSHYERLKSIENLVESGAKLTRQLLGYARKGRYEVEPMNLNRLLELTSDTFGRTRKDIIIKKELADDLLPIDADYGQIEQVIMNLFVNAADAMPSGGTVFIKTSNKEHTDFLGHIYEPKPGDYIMLTFRDTGVGMDKKTKENIFDPFFTTKEMGRGTGLGLASVYGIIKGHAGYIDVDSEKGKGAAFTIYLPASKGTVQEKAPIGGKAIEGKETILLVDDEEIILETCKDMLELLGYQVLTARNGKEAVNVFNKKPDSISLVILDMVMPKMGGSEVFDILKAIRSDIKVLLYSGYSIEGQAAKIMERGCDGFIQKPFHLKSLSEKVREILDRN